MPSRPGTPPRHLRQARGDACGPALSSPALRAPPSYGSSPAPLAGLDLTVHTGTGPGRQHVGLANVIIAAPTAGLAGWGLGALLERATRNPRRPGMRYGRTARSHGSEPGFLGVPRHGLGAFGRHARESCGCSPIRPCAG